MNQLEIRNIVREKIKRHIENHKEPEVCITFIFKGKDFKFYEHIYIFAGIRYRNVNFDAESAIKVIPNNFDYDEFDFIGARCITTPVRCHGFGDNWATEKWIYYFERKERYENNK